MFTAKNFVSPDTIEEAYKLNQKRSNKIVGGMIWLKMSKQNYDTIIDLSKLGLDKIEENKDCFEIGAYVTLRDIETHAQLNNCFNNALRNAVKSIVGVQFRNCATVGGSIFGRYGFSDVLTMFLALDTWVELYHAGRIPLAEFAQMKKDRDILEAVIVKKTPQQSVYLSQRNTETDFPVLTCAVSLCGGRARTVIGARPGRAKIVEDPEGILNGFEKMSETERTGAVQKFAEYAAEHMVFGSNMRASEEYRKLLAEVLVRRAWETLGGMKR